MILPLLLVGVLLIAGGIFIWTSRERVQEVVGTQEKVSLGTIESGRSSLIWVAQDRGFFTKQGLDVAIQVYGSGFAATKDLLAGSLDMVTAAEAVAVGNSFTRNDLRIVGVISEYDDISVVGRKDRGISELADLKGKKIGVVRGSDAEFCLTRCLTLQNIPRDTVHIVDLAPSQQVEALQNGDIDAAVVWEPVVQKMKNMLRANSVSFSAQSDQALHWVLICKENMELKRPHVIERFLAAMLRAEEFLVANRTEAKAIVARRLNLESTNVESVWKDSRFQVTLPQALLLTMEDQARWMMSTARELGNEVPDFLDHVYFGALQKLRPEAITVFH
jgi:ABC-type nitrate/sulfonate/bicarbonate transport system substrate-binding protein